LKSERVQSNGPIHTGTTDTTKTGSSCRVWRIWRCELSRPDRPTRHRQHCLVVSGGRCELGIMLNCWSAAVARTCVRSCAVTLPRPALESSFSASKVAYESPELRPVDAWPPRDTERLGRGNAADRPAIVCRRFCLNDCKRDVSCTTCEVQKDDSHATDKGRTWRRRRDTSAALRPCSSSGRSLTLTEFTSVVTFTRAKLC